MAHRKRQYKRDTPPEKYRDFKLFVIACEGKKTEPEYFNVLRHCSRRIVVDVIETEKYDEKTGKLKEHKSAPRWVLDQATKYVEKNYLKEEDDLWFVIDVDRWEDEQLREIAEYCKAKKNWNIVLSNPCFEVWLCFHKKSDVRALELKDCKDFKAKIGELKKEIDYPFGFIELMEDAIGNAKAADSDKNHFFPKHNETKVYQLAETIMRTVGKSGFDEFIKETLPKQNGKTHSPKNS